MKHTHLIWKELETKQVYQCRVFSVRDTTSEAPDGTKSVFSVIDAPDWVIVIPLIEKPAGSHFLMVRQWRHGSRSLSLEFPGGVLEQGETQEVGAQRELTEETGYRAGTITKLGEFNPNPAIMSNRVHVFLAKDLIYTGNQDLDDDEYVDVEQVPIHEVLKGMGKAPYIHALMASALCLYLAFGSGA
ncbi:NUDIX hydrolase [Gracilinema caldarium]|uniref:GDP-mannose pyrophosphatase n=1 Tax=Gracilinema caldarium (strain ATCC 51460 / DSM 7334 / H1) TaxID=744872 RepID=F8EYM3_GRAC1|nr:NUDIX hydrolase [Gracilinema caldarium]AEJ18600.1 NUDIX hydrolase [Gracilinema caldarium DSM 7334]